MSVIEIRKQEFKKSNNLFDLESDASLNVQEKFSYNSQLFQAESQKSLAIFLLNTISEDTFQYLPLNIGFDNFDLDMMISDYNQILRDRDKFMADAGPNNTFIKSLENQLGNSLQNIENSITNYLNSIEIKISNLKKKEKEFGDIYKDVPENEKILRTIERELQVKEALFLLLLQKREEAAINFAVVKPTIKVIDYAMSGSRPEFPKKNNIYLLALLISFSVPLAFLYLKFLFDDKFHNKNQLLKLLNNEMPVIGEIPYVKNDNDLNNLINNNSRLPISESIRMIMANLKLSISLLASNNIKNNTITVLVTSSIKGEGKTIISSNISSLLSSNNKVLLIGADLRNPQIHRS